MPRSSAPSASSVACLLSVFHLLYLRQYLQCCTYVRSTAIPSASAMPHIYLLLLVCYLCAWVICSVCIFYALSAPSTSTRAMLYLCCVVRSSVNVYVCSVYSSSVSYMACLLCLCWLIRYSVCICVYSSFALSASSVTYLSFVYLNHLFRLHFLCLIYFVCICVCYICTCACVCFLLCQRCCFFENFYIISFNSRHLCQV